MTEDKYAELRVALARERGKDHNLEPFCLFVFHNGDSILDLLAERDRLMEEVDPKYLDALSAARNFLELFLAGKANGFQAQILEKALEKVGY